ncbi:MAG: YSC84-related protein [Candidatus Competibacteraceae bacterium]
MLKMQRISGMVAPIAPFRAFMTALLVALGLGLQACSTAPMSPYQVEEQRAEIREMANETTARLSQQYPDFRRQLQRSAGYAAFSNFGFKVLFMGSATGQGIAVSRATRRETFMRMVELQPGYGFGVQRFRLVFVFETPQAFDQFVHSGWEFGGNVMASAQTRTQQMGNQLGVSVSPGVLMYQLSEQGAIVGISITGAKYYPDSSLN